MVDRVNKVQLPLNDCIVYIHEMTIKIKIERETYL